MIHTHESGSLMLPWRDQGRQGVLTLLWACPAFFQ